MHDPAPEAPIPALIEHIRARFHETNRRDFPELVALARKVETVHADDINAAHGLSCVLQAVGADLEDHMRKEEAVVFPALEAGRHPEMENPFPGPRDDHAGQAAAQNRIAAITHEVRLPAHACGSWRRLYAGLGKMAEDLDEHRYLENVVPFPGSRPVGERIRRICIAALHGG